MQQAGNITMYMHSHSTATQQVLPNAGTNGTLLHRMQEQSKQCSIICCVEQ
jgi:D-alanyl-D-alanine carboxypeptidase